MRVLTYVNSRQERAELIALLQSRGIPVFADDPLAVRDASRTAVYVCLADQYEDALALLKDPEHIVDKPVDVDAFWKATSDTEPTLLRWWLVVLAVLVPLWLIIVGIRFFAR